MEVHLQILEKITNENPPTLRKRSIVVTSDSVTIGTDPHADVVLTHFRDPFLIEIKFAENSWWAVNVHKHKAVFLNQNALIFEQRLKPQDQINIQGHRIIFDIRGSSKLDAPKFNFKPNSQEELWDYLMNEKEFDEVLINGPKQIFVDYRGNLFKSPWAFKEESFLIQKIKDFGMKGEGWYSGRLNRTLRIQAALPPVVEYPHIAIRKAKQTVLSLEELQRTQFGNTEEIDFLSRALAEKQNILIAGGTSTGKTVLLRSLVEKIPSDERVIVVEEEAEVDWPHPHLVAIESGRGNLRSAIIECLRMRPSRLIVSEVRGAEAFDMLQAMNTGHSGSMTTLHANSPREVLSRLESLLLSANLGMTVSAARRQIAQAIHIIVQLTRDENGKRKIDQIVRVTGIQNDVILLSDPVALEAAGIKQVTK